MILGPDGSPVTTAARERPASFSGLFEAAKASGFRGMFFFPNLNSGDSMPHFTREQIMAKASWLYWNVDAVRLIIDGLAIEEVDTSLWPKATTSDPAFNKLVTDLFHEENKKPRNFHAAGRESFYSAQVLIRRSIRLYGELFGQLMRPGEVRPTACMHFINPWQCSPGLGKQKEEEGWREGVKLDKFTAPLAYRFRTGSGDEFREVPALDILPFHDPLLNGQVRGMSALTPICKKLFSVDDIERGETASVLQRARMAYTIQRGDGDNSPFLATGASETETIKQADGTEVILQKFINKDPDTVEIATLPADYKMSVLESSRQTMTVEYLVHLYRGIANATLYPVEYVFSLGQLGQGTLVRMVQKRVQRIKKHIRQHQLEPQLVDRWYIFWLWKKISSGFFKNVPADWWRYRCIHPADDSVDVGREGKLYDARLETGKMAPSVYHGNNGEDPEDVEDEVIDAFVRQLGKVEAKKKANPELADQITHSAIFGKGQAAVAPVEDDPPDPPEDPKKNKKAKADD